jgi:hypothetical protein
MSRDTVTLYHGTSREAAGRILCEGLRAPAHIMHPAGWLMLTTSRGQAARYGRGAVLTFEIPADEMSYRHERGRVWPGEAHNVYGFDATAYAPKGIIPAEYVTDVTFTTEESEAQR